jgi:hypothetical protein
VKTAGLIASAPASYRKLRLTTKFGRTPPSHSQFCVGTTSKILSRKHESLMPVLMLRKTNSVMVTLRRHISMEWTSVSLSLLTFSPSPRSSTSLEVMKLRLVVRSASTSTVLGVSFSRTMSIVPKSFVASVALMLEVPPPGHSCLFP